MRGHSGYAMSVDVEDYFQVWAFSDIIEKQSWEGFSPRVDSSTRACLDLFDAHNIKATFFTLGWVAERNPDLIREIVARGHELASHGYDHTKVNEQLSEEFYNDVYKTKDILESIAGVKIKGFRAAGFSLDQTTPWAHELLCKAGYDYSSSTHPIRHDHYGDDNGVQTPYHPVPGADFVEAPVATLNVFGRRISCAGGGWFRAFPVIISDKLLTKAGRSLDGPVIFYFHPWEIDKGQPRFNNATLKSKFRHYFNIHKMETKLGSILKSFPWTPINEQLNIWRCTQREKNPTVI